MKFFLQLKLLLSVAKSSLKDLVVGSCMFSQDQPLGSMTQPPVLCFASVPVILNEAVQTGKHKGDVLTLAVAGTKKK